MEAFGIIAVNAVVGVLIGLSGIGGFFLPLYYLNVVGSPIKISLSLSFSAFLVSGIIGSISYIREKWISKFPAIVLAISCLFGSVMGVSLSDMVPEGVIKITLYTITLISGVSLLKTRKTHVRSYILDKPLFWVISGVFIGGICSVSGVGGALLFVPILAFLGMQLPSAVGLGIMASVFISIPAMIGYFVQTSGVSFDATFMVAMLFHAGGVLLGACWSTKINHATLKKVVGIIAILSAGFLMATQFIPA